MYINKIIMAPNHLIPQTLFYIYEGGEDWTVLKNLLNLHENYDRHKARELISSYINKFIQVKDKEHPLLNSPFLLLRQLVDLLQQDSKGSNINLFNDPPSVF